MSTRRKTWGSSWARAVALVAAVCLGGGIVRAQPGRVIDLTPMEALRAGPSRT